MREAGPLPFSDHDGDLYERERSQRIAEGNQTTSEVSEKTQGSRKSPGRDRGIGGRGGIQSLEAGGPDSAHPNTGRAGYPASFFHARPAERSRLYRGFRPRSGALPASVHTEIPRAVYRALRSEDLLCKTAAAAITGSGAGISSRSQDAVL